MSMAYLAQPEQQQQLEWLDGGTLAILLDGKATNGQLMVERFDICEGEAPPLTARLPKKFLSAAGPVAVRQPRSTGFARCRRRSSGSAC
jgi:hypothetical protein